MKTKCTLILASLLLVSVSLLAQTKKTTKPPVSQTNDVKKTETPAPNGQPTDAETKAWMSYMTPGEVHNMLAKCDGDWKEEITFWMAPGGPPTQTSSTCTNTMILGGRYQESIHKGNMMGMPFEGKGVVGYDNIRKVLQSTWVDNMGTGIMTTEGAYDAKTKSATLTGKMLDPMSGKMENVREVMTFISENSQRMEMYITKNGKEFKNMEIKYSR